MYYQKKQVNVQGLVGYAQRDIIVEILTSKRFLLRNHTHYDTCLHFVAS